jgi:hypothetical protein
MMLDVVFLVMLDVVFLATGATFLGICVLYSYACERL